MFVLGLEEGCVFSAPIEDPVLLDVERAHLGLPNSLERIHAQVSQVLLRLAGAECERAVFSYSTRDLRETRENVSSWPFKQAWRIVPGPGAEDEELLRLCRKLLPARSPRRAALGSRIERLERMEAPA